MHTNSRRVPSARREFLAYGLRWSGALSALSRLPGRESLIVLTYHRVGDHEHDPFDPVVFSATADQFDDQVAFLKRNNLLVDFEEALAFVDGTLKESDNRCRVLLTFDDGYLDNFETAFPILRSHGAQGVFFLSTDIVGSNHVPVWDYIAYLVKASDRTRFSLTYPKRLDVDIERDGMMLSLQRILQLFRSPENLDSNRFLEEVREVTGIKDVRDNSRRFLSWDEAREMIKGGMEIGAHTISHPMLSKLGVEEQRRELTESRAILQQKLGTKVAAVAYPFGTVSAFTEETQRLASEAGYRAAFSYYGGTNVRETANRFDIKRVSVERQSGPRFRSQVVICGLTGKFWP